MAILPQHWHVFNSYEVLCARSAVFLLKTAADVLSRQEAFTWVISGGRTPEGFFRQVATQARSERIDWGRVWVFWADERCVAFDSADSNYGLAKRTMLNQLPIPAEQVVRIPVDRGDPAFAVLQYEKQLREIFQLGRNECPMFDVVFLGMGADGHIASLMPESKALHNQDHLAAAVSQLNLSHDRVTLTMPVLQAAHRLAFLISGEDKAQTLYTIFEEGNMSYPICRLLGEDHKTIWLLDAAAAQLLR